MVIAEDIKISVIILQRVCVWYYAPTVYCLGGQRQKTRQMNSTTIYLKCARNIPIPTRGGATQILQSMELVLIQNASGPVYATF